MTRDKSKNQGGTYHEHERARANEQDKWETYYASLKLAQESTALRDFNDEFAALVGELLPDGGSVLEAGCGGGSQGLAVAQRGQYQIHLMDFSEAALRVARQRFEQAEIEAEFVLGDVCEPGEPQYDLVFNAGVLEHYTLAEQCTFLRGMASRSRRYVLALVPNRLCYWYWVWRTQKMSQAAWPYGKENPLIDLRAAFEGAGLHFIGHAFLGQNWAEDFIHSLKEIGAGLKQRILEIHRQPIVPAAQKAYLLAALGTVDKPVKCLPTGWNTSPLHEEHAQAELISALADALALRIQAETERARLNGQRHELEDRYHALEVDATHLKASVDKLSDQVERDKTEQARLQGRLEAKDELIRQLTNQFSAHERTLTDLKQRCVEQERLVSAHKREATEASRLSRELSSARQRLKSLAADVRKARSEVDQRSNLQQRNQELEKKLRFTNAHGRDIAAQLQEIWDSPTWQFLNRLHNSRIAGGTWRSVKALVPEGWKENAKQWIRDKGVSHGRTRQPVRYGTSGKTDTERAARLKTKSGEPSENERTRAELAPTWRSNAEVGVGLEEFLATVEDSSVSDLVLFVAGVKFVESEGQRVTQIIRELVRNGVPVLMLYFRWQSEYHQRVPRPHDPLFFQMPMDLFERHSAQFLQRSYRPSLRRACVFEFPHPATFQWVNEFNLAGWKTVYDIIDDWEEFHQVGKAVWYEPAVEKYLCANCNAVSAIVPLLAQKAERWVPGLKVVSIPNGVSPDSFDMSLAARPLRRGRVTVGYFGYLTPAWFDWELVTQVAVQHPTWQFHIVGYGESLPTKLPENIQLLGKVAHHLLYGYTRNWDVGIVPFRPGMLSKGADPIKVYEYLTLGLPVVATEIPHLRDYPGVYVAASQEEFSRLLEEAAVRKLNRSEVRAFIERSTWYQRGLALIEAGQQGTQNTLLPNTILAGEAS